MTREASAAEVELWNRMAEHTAPECASSCKLPRSCCDPMYCEVTAQYALDEFGVTLPRPGFHPSLPFMGPTGCTVAPHLRPICSLHVCSINSLGFKPGDPAWTERYFDLRAQIDEGPGLHTDDIVD